MAALVAGGLARLSERVAGATDGSPLIVGQNNTSATGTSVSTSLPAGVTASAFVASNSKLAPGCYGLFGFLNGFGDGSVAAGVGGTSNGGHGLYGASSTNSAQAPAYGVLGGAWHEHWRTRRVRREPEWLDDRRPGRVGAGTD